MFGRFGPGEIAVIALLVLVVFGAKRLPELGRSLGLGLASFRRALKGGEAKISPGERPPASTDNQSSSSEAEPKA